MTIEEIRKSPKYMLSPTDISEVLGSDPETIRVTARTYPERIGFPFTFIGNRMKVPRMGFIRWMEGEHHEQ